MKKQKNNGMLDGMMKHESSESIIGKIKNNHLLMMIICCSVPLLLLWAAVYFFDLSKSYLFWFMILLCPLMHYFMMKDMHKGKGSRNKKEKGGCH